MRLIIFRGKTHTGIWVHGYFSKNSDGDSIITTLNGKDSFCVKENTIGQFTGYEDEHYNRVFENDIVQYLGAKGLVFYCDKSCMFMVDFKESNTIYSFDSIGGGTVWVLGNNFDNPELLK